MTITLTISGDDSDSNDSASQKNSATFSSDREYKIGRLHDSSSNDWDLIDPDNKISRHHATVFFKHGRYFIRDNKSVSGIWFCTSEFSDEEKEIDGELALEDGMVLFIGFYEINVRIEESIQTNSNPEPIAVVQTESEPEPEPTPLEPSFIEPDPEPIIEEPVVEPEPEPYVQPEPTPYVQPEPAPIVETQTGSDANFLAPFLEGLGIELSAEEISKLKADDIKMLGESFRETIDGMIRLNRMRDDIKRSFDLDDTVFRSNNILKRANDAKLTLKTVITTPQNYTPLNSSITEIYKNIYELLYILKNLPRIPAKSIHNFIAPVEIEKLTQEQNNKAKLFGKKNNWDIFCEEYTKIDVEEEIAVAYKEELANYARKQHN